MKRGARAPRLVACRLCQGGGVLAAGTWDEMACPDCDGLGAIEEGGAVHAQQLKLARNPRGRAAE